jgi:carnitine-CoA ligase
VGVPSELSDEEVKAYVVPVAGAKLDVGELREFAAARLTAFKVPRFWQVLDALPRTPTGRVAKHHLPAAGAAGEIDAALPVTPLGRAGRDRR